MKQIWKSHAEWPESSEIIGLDGTRITTDNHPTESSAHAICNLLHKEGFGGDGKIFPIRTWVSSKTTIELVDVVKTDVFSDEEKNAEIAEISDPRYPDDSFFVRLYAWDWTGKHEIMKSLEGKKVRVTIETIED